jgi:putative RNA 2'-phosphotransferase
MAAQSTPAAATAATAANAASSQRSALSIAHHENFGAPLVWLLARNFRKNRNANLQAGCSLVCMAAPRSTELSKLLSLVLRHEPEQMGLVLDEAGWVSVESLLLGFANHGTPISRQQLDELVRDSDKQRFALNADGLRIRANQGHSVAVALGHATATPPARLFHGTIGAFLDSIRNQGLVRGKRHHVHLSSLAATASRVGERRGRAVVLEVRALEMAQAGYAFFLSANGVWLTELVPPAYINFPADTA